MDDFTKWLIANDFIEEGEDVEALSEKAVKKLKAQFEAEQKPPESPHGADFLKTLQAERQEKARIEEIDKLAADAIREYPTQLETIENIVNAAHKDKTVDARGFELALLRAMRPIGPSPVRPANSKDIGNSVITAAICKTLKMRSLEKVFDSKTLDATDKYFRYGIGLQQLLFRAAAANGEHIDSAANTRRLLEAAFGRTSEGLTIRAGGFSTISLPGILSDVMNKMLVDYFNAVDPTWRLISAISPVRDFREISSYSLTGDLEYEAIGPTGEIKHGTLGETTYGNRADTYGKMLAITRTDIINDDVGAFQRVPQKLGRGGSKKINSVFWTEFLDNASFFASGNSNVSTGAGSALGTADGAAINAAEVIFMNQTDPDGKPLGIQPSILLAPPTLLNTATRWMGGQLIVTGADTTQPNVNVYQGRYRVASSPYMENSTFTGNSAAAWYLLADPADMPVIEVVFLNGQEMPTVESADADFNTLGIQTRAYHDFGVRKQEPRGGVRSAGS
jgi:hypothetical protein